MTLIFPLNPSFTTLCLKDRSMPSFVAGTPFGHAMLWSPPYRGWIWNYLSDFRANHGNPFSRVLMFTSSVDVTVKPTSSVQVKLLAIGASPIFAVSWKTEYLYWWGGAWGFTIVELVFFHCCSHYIIFSV
jgi:hypothetical protein